MIEILNDYVLLFEQDKKFHQGFSKIIEIPIKMIQFDIVGGLIIILNAAIIYLLTNILDIYYFISAILLYLDKGLSFFLNEKWTFNSITQHIRKYGIVFSSAPKVSGLTHNYIRYPLPYD